MEPEILAATLQDILARDDRSALRRLIGEQHPADIAAELDRQPPEQVQQALRLLRPADQAELFGYLGPEQQVALAERLGRRALARLVAAMSHDERADLYNQLDPEQRETLLPALAQAERDDIRRLASYPEGTAGALMTSDYATLGPGQTAGEALATLRREAPDRETIYQAFVIDPERRLIGTVSLRDLILAAPSTPVRTLMTEEVISARADDPGESVAQKVAKYDLIALPVVDGEDRLVGIVTYDDAMDVAEEEATEDFHKTATVSGRLGSLRAAGIFTLYRKRIFWLVLLVFGNLFSGAGIALFEDVIASHVALVFFLPLLVGSAGNAGSQAATLMVRALATGDVQARDWGRLLGREVLVAGALGLTMALAVYGIGLLRGGLGVALSVASTMLAVVLCGSLIGLSLPFVLSRLRLDPATASGPLVTTLADVVGIVIYFSIATTVLGLG